MTAEDRVQTFTVVVVSQTPVPPFDCDGLRRLIDRDAFGTWESRVFEGVWNVDG